MFFIVVKMAENQPNPPPGALQLNLGNVPVLSQINGRNPVVQLPVNALTNEVRQMFTQYVQQQQQHHQAPHHQHVHSHGNHGNVQTPAANAPRLSQHNHSVSENSIIINMEDEESSLSEQNGSHGNNNQQPESNGSHGNSQSFASLPYDADYVNWSLKQSFPFLLLLLLKVAYSLRLGE